MFKEYSLVEQDKQIHALKDELDKVKEEIKTHKDQILER